MLIFVFCFSGLFIWPLNINPNDGVCVPFHGTSEPATMAPNEIRGLVMVPCQRRVSNRPPADQRRDAVVRAEASE